MFKHTPDWWENKAETTATVISVLHQPETVFRYEFFVDSKAYKGGYAFYENNVGVVVGTKYKVVYNPLNPEQNHIQLHTQFFEESEQVGYTFTEVKGISLLQVERDSFEIIRLRFSIVVDGKKYSSIRNEFINIQGFKHEDIVGKKFKVKYWVENPWRSIILLDEPVDSLFEAKILEEERIKDERYYQFLDKSPKFTLLGVRKGHDYFGVIPALYDGDYRKVVNGVYLNFFMSDQIKKVNGLSFMFMGYDIEEFNGLSFIALGGTFRKYNGGFVGAVFGAQKFKGVGITYLYGSGELVNGVLINGLFSTGDKINGVALTSLVNWYDEVNGIQFGLFNRAKTGNLVQIGVINHIKDNPKLLRTLPLLNLRFSK